MVAVKFVSCELCASPHVSCVLVPLTRLDKGIASYALHSFPKLVTGKERVNPTKYSLAASCCPIVSNFTAISHQLIGLIQVKVKGSLSH